ncbi:Fucose 4-O-acetylase [Paenibacillus uliginis N3/975]|uniref:Fucose 4-O-acetylase n=1 Tax=Paenibacillus uliginis N3/975 TaxID=1313296 RepID=A0A1X7HN87_9BACL|nr:fucose 4-O-acetylase [Paenibacillus uliginis]SMF88964.1 Fucose 4-O-acetylase [Paenibacillus uliginis N3/975]
MNRTIEQKGETFFLNLRFILIVTVFVGNAIEPLISRMDSLHTLYLWIFSFHMPLFVLVTGYFAKSSLMGKTGRKVILQIAIQYVIFQSLYSLLDAVFFHVDDIHRSFFAPYLLLWFLFSHACWRLLLLSMGKLTAGQQLFFAAVLGVIAGYLPVDGVWLSVSRTFVFFPFFLVGYHFSFETFALRFKPWIKGIAATISLLLFIGFSVWGSNLPAGWLYGSMTYAELGQDVWYAGLFRIAVYALQLTASAAFLSWVPMTMGRITDLGRRTLYVFLLHGFIIRLMDFSGLHESISHFGGAMLLIAAAILCTVLLAQPGFKRLFHPVIEPSVDGILRLENVAIRRFFVR